MAAQREIEEKKSPITEEMKSYVGKEYTYQTVRVSKDVNTSLHYIPFNPGGYNEDVTQDNISKFAVLTTQDFNPLWHDDRYAKKTRWGGVVAPPTFIVSVDLGNYAWYEVRGWPKEYSGHWHAASEMEFFKPIRPGDHISVVSKLRPIYTKEGRRGGLLIFLEVEGKYTNQKGEHVATIVNTFISSTTTSLDTGLGGWKARPAVPPDVQGKDWIVPRVKEAEGRSHGEAD